MGVRGILLSFVPSFPIGSGTWPLSHLSFFCFPTSSPSGGREEGGEGMFEEVVNEEKNTKVQVEREEEEEEKEDEEEERRGRRTIWSHALHEEREGLPSWQMEVHEERVEQVECEHGCGSLWKGAWTGSPCGGASGLSCPSCALGCGGRSCSCTRSGSCEFFFGGGW